MRAARGRWRERERGGTEGEDVSGERGNSRVIVCLRRKEEEKTCKGGYLVVVYGRVNREGWLEKREQLTALTSAGPLFGHGRPAHT